MSESNETIGKRIKARRKELRMTQVELGQKVGAATRTIQDWEADKHLPRPTAIRMLAIVLNTTHEWIESGCNS